MTDRDDRTLNLVRLMIAVLCAAAFLLIVLIINGSGLNETAGRAVAMAVAAAFFSLTAVAGTNLANRRPEISAVGYLTVVASGAALLAVFASIWSDDFQDDNWRVAVDLTLVALGAGHSSLLLGSARPKDSDTVRLVRTGVLITIPLLLVMAIAEISSPGRDIGWEPFGVLGVLYLLGTSVLPLLRRMPSAAAPTPAAAPAPAGRALGLDQIAIAVTDRARSDRFYRDVLGAEVVPVADGGVAYRIGSQQLAVRGSPSLCVAWGGTPQEAVDHLTALGVAVIDGPVAGSGAQGSGTSVYCRDPDGSLIELISYG